VKSKYQISSGVYPAFCGSRNDKSNNLGVTVRRDAYMKYCIDPEQVQDEKQINGLISTTKDLTSPLERAGGLKMSRIYSCPSIY